MTLMLFFYSCKPEPSGTANQIYINQSNAVIKVVLYPLLPPFSFHNNTFLLNPGESFIFSNSEIGTHPSRLYSYFLNNDSALVVYNDTLNVVHYNINVDIDNANESIIEYSEPHNIFNKESFTLNIQSDEYYRYIYTFTNDDFEYAISINE